MRFIKKPVVINAIQFIYGGKFDSCRELKEWMGDSYLYSKMERHPGAVAKIGIKTMEGDMEGKNRDYIIRGVRGEFYACDESIFLETYDPINPNE